MKCGRKQLRRHGGETGCDGLRSGVGKNTKKKAHEVKKPLACKQRGGWPNSAKSMPCDSSVILNLEKTGREGPRYRRGSRGNRGGHWLQEFGEPVVVALRHGAAWMLLKEGSFHESP